MIHPHDQNSPLLGAAIGALAGVYRSLTSVLTVITWDGIYETAVYAIIGAAVGSSVSFMVTRGFKKLFKK